MSGRHRASYGRLATEGRPHWDVVSNLLAVQARLRGDAALSGHPAGAARDGTEPGPDAAAEDLAEVIPLPGAASSPVANPLPATVSEARPETPERPEDVGVRLDRLEAELAALLDRLGPAGPAGHGSRGSVEDAIVRLQRAVDRRLGSSS
jgi:hypothetical protein